MLIQHNQQAIFTQNRLRATTGQRAKASEKLSTGYRINHAADDAAGLQISEKLRWQVRGLDRASENISDGLSYIQVADGALEEVHSMLQRMNELCTQAANDTNTAADRNAISAEIRQLQDATESVFTDTKFNTFHVFTLDETNAPPGSPIHKGLLNVIEPANITQEGNLANTLTFDDAADWVSSGNQKPQYNTVEKIYDPATGNVVGSPTTSTTNSNTIPDLTHNGVTYSLQANWTALLSSVPSGGTVTANGITYTRSGNTLTYQSGNDTVELQFSSNYWKGQTYYHMTSASATTTDASGNKISDSVLSYQSREGSGASFVQGVTYPASYIDFSGLGTAYQVDDLIDLGFASTCSHGCGNYYSNVTSGAQIVAAMVDAATKSRGFDGHWEQLAYNVNQPDRMYLYEDTPSIASGSQSTWEPKPRSASGDLVSIEEELHIQSSALAHTAVIILKPAMSNALLKIDSLPVNSYTAAGHSMQAVQDAIVYVSSKRSYLGAMQNRLEHARSVDDSSSENSQSAESRIRDADIAKEMILYSALNILQQAGESVLAQANQNPQNILSLFS